MYSEEEWLENCIADYSSEQGHATIVANVYPDSSCHSEDSFLATSADFMNMKFILPNVNDLIRFDEVAIAENASNLHLIVWIGLQWDMLHVRNAKPNRC